VHHKSLLYTVSSQKLNILSLKIGLKILFKNLWECESVFARRLIKEIPTIGKYEHWATFCESCEQPVRSNALMIDFKMCCLHVVLVLPGSVETQLGLSGKFC